MDLSPNLGSINRAALIAADYIVIPLALDFFSLQGLQTIGYTFHNWRNDWKYRLSRKNPKSMLLPKGDIQPVGYVVLQMAIRLDRLAKVDDKVIAQIPNTYQKLVSNQPSENPISIEKDPNCLGLIKNYQSLMPMAQEAHKPMFSLKPADGAIGAYTKVVKNVYDDFKKLAYKIAEQTQVEI